MPSGRGTDGRNIIMADSIPALRRCGFRGLVSLLHRASLNKVGHRHSHAQRPPAHTDATKGTQGRSGCLQSINGQSCLLWINRQLQPVSACCGSTGDSKVRGILYREGLESNIGYKQTPGGREGRGRGTPPPPFLTFKYVTSARKSRPTAFATCKVFYLTLHVP